MKEYITKKEYEEIIEEKERFKKLFKLLKIDSEEIIKEKRKNSTITYFCIANSKEKTYITFYNSDSEDLIQVLLSEEINIFDYLEESLIEEVNVEKPQDNFNYRGFNFEYLEEPYFIKQIFEGIKFEDTELIKEINQEIEFYKDKITEQKQDIFDYTMTNNILSKYRFEMGENSNEEN